MSQLKVDDIVFSYNDQDCLLDGISFSVKEGEKVGIIGPNGSGKTTLFLIMCGILQPEKGCIYYKSGKIVYKKFNPDIAYLFQNPDDQLFCSSVYDDIAFGPVNMKLSVTDVDNRVKSALKDVGLESVAGKSPHHLSGGQKRLAALASILSMNPSLLLLDEPVSNLDAKNRRNVINKINSINDISMLIASHDLEFLLETCDRCILIDDCRIVADRLIKDLLSDQALLIKHELEKPHSLIPHTHKGSVINNPMTH